MADRKSRSVRFKLAFQVNIGVLKIGIERVTSEEITVFQNIGNDEFLVELKSKNAAEALIEEGFDVEELHVCCHPPQGYYTNVSIMGLPSYVEDDEVIEALKPYGEIKSEIFRLKYKRDHELAGIENGNRLVKIILATRSIPYSMKIGGQWCRIIHNDQQPVCSECRQEGHTRRRCPDIECRRCKNKGHMSYDCDKEYSNEPEENQGAEASAPNDRSYHGDKTETKESENQGTSGTVPDEVNEEMEISQKDETEQVYKGKEHMVYEDGIQGQKRPLSTDSEPDGEKPHRRQRHKPVPNLEGARTRSINSSQRQSANNKV